MDNKCSCRRSQEGNIIFVLFGAVALVAVLGAALMTFLRGPLSSSVLITKRNSAENQMAVGAQVAVMSAASQSNSGDCDSDGYVEPVEWRTATTEPHPTGGGLVPLTIGMNKKDPWGTEYGYCVWNHGTVLSGSGCNANMIQGTNSRLYPTVALVSAGPDKTFTTTCRSFATADANSDGDLLDAVDSPLVSKAAESDDDVIFTYTYEEATGASGGLWNLKTGDTTTAQIAKDIEVTGDSTVSGTGSYSLGVILPDSSAIPCDGTMTGVMAKNAAGTAVQICDGTTWQSISSGGGGGGSSAMQLQNQTVNGNSSCTAGNIGLMRYKTTATGDKNTDTSTSTDISGTVAYSGITSVGSSAASSGNGSVLLTLPSGTRAGDLIILGVNSRGHTVPPAGFNQNAVGGIDISDFESIANEGAVFFKTLGSEDKYVFLMSGTSDVVAAAAVYRGVDASGIPVSSLGPVSCCTAIPGPWSVSSSGVTTTAANSKVVFIGYAALSSTTAGGTVSYAPPTGFTELQDVQGVNLSGDGAYAGIEIADKTFSAAGATGAFSGSMTASTGGVATTGSFVLALPPLIQSAGVNTVTTTTVTKDTSYSTYAEICNGSSWVTVSRGTLNDLSDVAVNYSGTASASTSNSTYSFFMGSGNGASATSGASMNSGIGIEALYGLTSGQQNSSFGNYALRQTAGGFNNTAFGYNTLRSGTSHSGNTAFGSGAGYATTINSNIAVGRNSLYTNVAGGGSVAVGYMAMRYANNSGTSFASYNTAVGNYALSGSTTASSNTGTMNTAVGSLALYSNTSGSSNVAVGRSALYANTTGTGNSACGMNALNANTSGNYSVACGHNSSAANTQGNYNTALGTGALQGGTVMSNNTAVGYRALYNHNTSGTAADSFNTAIGHKALTGSGALITGTRNVAVGQAAMSYGGAVANSVAVGSSALFNATSAGGTAFGYYAGYSGTTTDIFAAFGAEAYRYGYNGAAVKYNTALGYQALRGSTTAGSNTGSGNTAVGYKSLYQYTTGANNTAIGAEAGQAITSSGTNTLIGYQAGYTMSTATGSVTAVGYQSVYSLNGSYNTALGDYALGTSSGTCAYNTAVGYNAAKGVAGSCASNNMVIGYKALSSVTTGGSNVAIGSHAGFGYNFSSASGVAVTTETTNTFIGYDTQLSAGGYSNSTALGNGAKITASNQIVLGNTAITGIYAQVTSITAISDRRKKKDIRDSDLGLAFINTLHPVSYRFNNGDDTLRYGLIAQEVREALPQNLKPLSDKNENGLALLTRDETKEKVYHMNYFELLAPLVKAVREIDDKLKSFLADFLKTMETLNGKVTELTGLFDEDEVQGKALDGKLDILEKTLRAAEGSHPKTASVKKT